MNLHDTFVITEDSIFKYLVAREDVEISDTKENVARFFRRFPINIFKDEYYVLYSALEQVNKFEIVLTYDYLHQIVLNNIVGIMNDNNIELYREQGLTEVELRERLIDHFLTAYDNLCDAYMEEDMSLEGSMEFYLQTWAGHEMERIIQNQLAIIQEGLTVGRRFYQGVADAKAYHDGAYMLVRSLMDGQGDSISNTIDTSTMSVEEIQAQLEEESIAEEITRTGVQALDSQYTYHKGEILTIQAGTGVGKTRFANALVHQSRLLGKNVLYLTLEQKSNRVLTMQLARHVLHRYGFFSDISDKSILRKQYNFEHTQKVQESLNDLVTNEAYGKLRIESVNIHASEVESMLINVWENGFHFDMVVIDYIGLLQTSGMNRYDALTDIVNMLKSSVKSFKGEGFLCVILNQLTKEAEKAILSGTFESGKNDGSETQYLARASDYIYTLTQRAEDKQANKVHIYIDKVRLGDITVPKIEAMSHLGHCYFADYNLDSRPQNRQHN